MVNLCLFSFLIVAVSSHSLSFGMRDPSIFSQRDGIAIRANNGTTNSSLQDNEPINERVERVSWDLRNLEEFYKVSSSPVRHQRLKQYYDEEISALGQAPFETYDQNGKIDYLLIQNHLRHKAREVQQAAGRDEKVFTFLGGNFTVRLAQAWKRDSA